MNFRVYCPNLKSVDPLDFYSGFSESSCRDLLVFRQCLTGNVGVVVDVNRDRQVRL